MSNPAELQTKIVTLTTVPYAELDRFVSLHLGKPYECIVGGGWRNGAKYGIDLGVLSEGDRAEHITEVTNWLAGTGEYDPYEQCPSPYAVLSYLRHRGIAVPTRLLVEVNY